MEFSEKCWFFLILVLPLHTPRMELLHTVLQEPGREPLSQHHYNPDRRTENILPKQGFIFRIKLV